MIERISRAIENVIKEKVDIDQLRNSKELINDLGLNSINRMRLILELEKIFQVQFDLEKIDISVFNNLECLEQYISNTLNENA